MSYFSKLKQDVVASIPNTSDVNIAGGAYFTGAADSTLGVAGIQVGFFADQNCLIYVEQSPDDAPSGPHWDISDSYQYYANSSFGITVQAIGSYVRVRVYNQSGSATTVFRLSTVLCPIVEALPRSLNNKGNLKVSIEQMHDIYNFKVENTPIGEMRTIIPTRLVGASFEGATLDSNFWINPTPTSPATATQANSQLILATAPTAGANGAVIIYSTRRARYISAYSMNFRAIVQLSAGVSNNKRRWGIAYGSAMPTITDGAYYELDGTTLSVVCVKGGIETLRIASGSFNGELGATYSIGTSVKTYEIYWTNSKVIFTIGDEILHTFSATTETWAATMSHYIYFDNVNSNGITSNNTLEVRVASIRRLGPLQTQPTSKFTSGLQVGVLCKGSPGNLHSVVFGANANNAVVTIYDGISTGGTIIYQTAKLATNEGELVIDFKGLPFHTGLFYTVTGASAQVMFIYE
jgi:hypothetical protein